MPKKIEKPPYYAIRSQAMSVSSSVGLRVNSSLEVINNNMEHVVFFRRFVALTRPGVVQQDQLHDFCTTLA